MFLVRLTSTILFFLSWKKVLLRPRVERGSPVSSVVGWPNHWPTAATLNELTKLSRICITFLSLLLRIHYDDSEKWMGEGWSSSIHRHVLFRRLSHRIIFTLRDRVDYKLNSWSFFLNEIICICLCVCLGNGEDRGWAGWACWIQSRMSK